jgi:hypothetical protein
MTTRTEELRYSDPMEPQAAQNIALVEDQATVKDAPLANSPAEWPICAVDIGSGGQVCVHRGHVDATDMPRFSCQLQANTIRVIFCTTSGSFSRQTPYENVSTEGNSRLGFIVCTECQGSGITSALPASSISSVSPCTSVHGHGSICASTASQHSCSSMSSSHVRVRSAEGGKRTEEATGSGLSCRDLLRFWTTDPTGSMITCNTYINSEASEFEDVKRFWDHTVFFQRHRLDLAKGEPEFYILSNHFYTRWMENKALEGKRNPLCIFSDNSF